LEAYNCKVATGEVTAETIAFAASGGKELKKRKADDQGTHGGSNGWCGQQPFRLRGGGFNACGVKLELRHISPFCQSIVGFHMRSQGSPNMTFSGPRLVTKKSCS